MSKPTPWPTHCPHEMSGHQMGTDHRCCWCKEPMQQWMKTGHGPFLPGAGELVNITGQRCDKRVAEDSEGERLYEASMSRLDPQR